MKPEIYFLIKATLVLTVVDAFIPRAETYERIHAKNKHGHNSPQFNHENQTFHPHPRHFTQPHHYPYSTEINMGLFDLNPFHGGGSGSSKQALDEQWEIQQAILRERRGHTDTTHVKKTKSIGSDSNSIEIAGAKKIEKLRMDDQNDHGHKKSLADMFFGVKKFEKD